MLNPYFSLLRTSWQYAGAEKRQCVLVYASFVVSSLGTAANPLLYGWLVDTLQGKDAPVLTSAALYIGGYLALQLFTGATHGPARVLERQLAFNISRNFLNELFHQLMHLPVHWHQDHHSGATINRLKKAYGSLKTFFQNGFFYFYTFVQFFFAFGAMLYFSPLFGMVALVLGVLTVWVIFKFDKPLVRSQEEVNEKEHLFLSSLTDSVSNILTVITLRLEKRMQIDLLGKFKGMLPPFRRNARVTEWKWFSATLLTDLIYVVMVGGYIYGHYTPGETFYLGGLVALLGFVNQFTSAFARIAIAYTNILTYYTDVQTTRPIQEAYRRKHRPEESLPLPSGWKSIRIERLNFNFNAIRAPVAQPPAAVGT
ncbi:MAG: ABC transporter ATP-binding protein, partial [Cytophagales bacterium]|nr:ABC transporter ATP-binding protein [Cytophagales bacterium]